jgi:predicted transcriptional regulator
MTRPKNQEVIEKEARFQEVMAAVLDKKHNTSSTTHIFNIPHQILYNQLKSDLRRQQAIALITLNIMIFKCRLPFEKIRSMLNDKTFFPKISDYK